MSQRVNTVALLHGVTNDVSFRILLALALEETRESAHPVLEMGIGGRSTPFLHDYCQQTGRRLVSVEENIRAAAVYRQLESRLHEFRVTSWNTSAIDFGMWSVALVLNAPGDRRKVDVARLWGNAEIVVVHDTEPAADYGYRLSEILPNFRSRVDIKTDGAWCSAVSNVHDLSRWRGRTFGPYVVSGGDEDARRDAHSDAMKRIIDGEASYEEAAEAGQV